MKSVNFSYERVALCRRYLFRNVFINKNSYPFTNVVSKYKYSVRVVTSSPALTPTTSLNVEVTFNEVVGAVTSTM